MAKAKVKPEVVAAAEPSSAPAVVPAAEKAVEAKKTYRKGSISAENLKQIKEALDNGQSLPDIVKRYPDKNGLLYKQASVEAALKGEKPKEKRPGKAAAVTAAVSAPDAAPLGFNAMLRKMVTEEVQKQLRTALSE